MKFGEGISFSPSHFGHPSSSYVVLGGGGEGGVCVRSCLVLCCVEVGIVRLMLVFSFCALYLSC